MKRVSKEEYKENKTNELKALQNQLDNFLKEAIGSKAKMQELTAHYRISGLYNYSFYNSLLIAMQGGTICQSFNKWQDMGRCVKKGEKSHISIFRPMIKKEKDDVTGEESAKLIGFKLSPVFDLKQTDGKALEYDHNSNDALDIPYKRISKVMEELTSAKVVEELTGNARGYSDGQKLVVSSMSNDVDKTKTLIHETVHHLIHTSKTAEKTKVSRAAMEVEAESSTFMVLAYLGMDFELSKAYVANWQAGIHEARTDLIVRTSDKIIKALKNEMTLEEQFLVGV